ncbi:MAG: RNA polymerase sigma factor [bacterium]|nr:RNA polymerase sigma factor [bacterium]
MNSEETQLILAAREGDDLAFARLVAMHDARVMSLARSIIGYGCDAEEVYQEIFLKVHRALPSFRFESEFSTWLHRVAVNVALSCRKSLARRKQKEQVMDGNDDFFTQTPAHPADNPENLKLREETLRLISQALEKLPDRQRTVFVMKHDQGMKLREIAKALGLAEGSVKAYMFRAIENLREILRPYYEGRL